MTYKKLEKDKIDEIRKLSVEVNNDNEEILNLEKEIKNKEERLEELINKYKSQYDTRVNPFNKIAILSAVNKWGETYEIHIESLKDDELRLSGYIRYSHQEFTISLNELLENGYVIKDDFLCVYTKTDNLEIVRKIVYWLLKVEKDKLVKSVNDNEKWVIKYKEELETAKKELKEFDTISDSKVKKIFNNIRFGLTDCEVETFLQSLPRKIEI